MPMMMSNNAFIASSAMSIPMASTGAVDPVQHQLASPNSCGFQASSPPFQYASSDLIESLLNARVLGSSVTSDNGCGVGSTFQVDLWDGDCVFDSDYFEELISGDQDVDLERLREASRFGIPESIRGEVWKLLLGVVKADKIDDLKHSKRIREEFSWLKCEWKQKGLLDVSMKRKIQNDVTRLFGSMWDAEQDEIFEDEILRAEMLLSVFMMDNKGIEYSSHFAQVLHPLLFVLRSDDDAEVYQCLCALIEVLENRILSRAGLENAIARFTLMFRTQCRDLHEAFEAEGIYSVSEWCVPWLQSMLAGALPVDNVVRLWDLYIADESCDLRFITRSGSNDSIMSWDDSCSSSSSFSADHSSPDHLHLYVMLTVLQASKERLLELEHTEIKSFLQSLPQFDMKQLIAQAINLQARCDS